MSAPFLTVRKSTPLQTHKIPLISSFAKYIFIYKHIRKYIDICEHL